MQHWVENVLIQLKIKWIKKKPLLFFGWELEVWTWKTLKAVWPKSAWLLVLTWTIAQLELPVTVPIHICGPSVKFNRAPSAYPAPTPPQKCPTYTLHSHCVIYTPRYTTMRDWMGYNPLGANQSLEEDPVSDGDREYRPGGRTGAQVRSAFHHFSSIPYPRVPGISLSLFL